jgi:hypothetical protein
MAPITTPSKNCYANCITIGFYLVGHRIFVETGNPADGTIGGLMPCHLNLLLGILKRRKAGCILPALPKCKDLLQAHNERTIKTVF